MKVKVFDVLMIKIGKNWSNAKTQSEIYILLETNELFNMKLKKNSPKTPEPTIMPKPNWTISLSSLKQAKILVVISKTEQPNANNMPAVCSRKSHLRQIISRQALNREIKKKEKRKNRVYASKNCSRDRPNQPLRK